MAFISGTMNAPIRRDIDVLLHPKSNGKVPAMCGLDAQSFFDRRDTGLDVVHHGIVWKNIPAGDKN